MIVLCNIFCLGSQLWLLSIYSAIYVCGLCNDVLQYGLRSASVYARLIDCIFLGKWGHERSLFWMIPSM
jgi:hypothetical protein